MALGNRGGGTGSVLSVSCKEEKVGDRAAEGILLYYLSHLGSSLEDKGDKWSL